MKGLTIKENNNFLSVKLYNKEITIEEILKQKQTKHLDKERMNRQELALECNKENGKQAKIDKIFVVDKGHINGEELHCISEKGIIFILNKRKYENNLNSFITILLARPNQVKRLYDACDIILQEKILKNTYFNVENDLNN